MCSGDWILNLDADEWVLDELIASIPSIIDENPHVEVYRLPRINTVVGLTLEHCNKWGWFVTQVENLPTVMKKLTQPEIDLLKAYSIEHTIDEDGTVEFQEPCVMWPDYQTRLYKRAPHIQWTGKVHETLTGHRMISNFPPLEFFAIRHFKTIDRQEQQNAKYSTIVR
jgi:hypothetical protein